VEGSSDQVVATSITVLHVEDDIEFAELNADFLSQEAPHLNIVVETDPENALSHLEENPEIECVVSDYSMPRKDGLELLEAIREVDPDLPFILCTGKGSEEVASEAISKGVTDYVRKGSSRERYQILAHRIENAVEQYRAERSAGQRTRTAPPAGDLLIVDREGTVEAVSPSVERTLGRDAADLAGDALADAVAPDDRGAIRDLIEQRDGGTPDETATETVAFRLLDDDGATHAVEATVRPLVGDDPRIALRPRATPDSE
jgi:PAS domain S-box-containing protein